MVVPTMLICDTADNNNNEKIIQVVIPEEFVVVLPQEMLVLIFHELRCSSLTGRVCLRRTCKWAYAQDAAFVQWNDPWSIALMQVLAAHDDRIYIALDAEKPKKASQLTMTSSFQMHGLSNYNSSSFDLPIIAEKLVNDRLLMLPSPEACYSFWLPPDFAMVKMDKSAEWVTFQLNVFGTPSIYMYV